MFSPSSDINPCHSLFFDRDHLQSNMGIICGPGSFAVQCGNHLLSGIICVSGIICGPVQNCPPRAEGRGGARIAMSRPPDASGLQGFFFPGGKNPLNDMSADQRFAPLQYLCLRRRGEMSTLGKINARAECGGIQRTHVYVKIRCVSDPVKLKDISHAHTNKTYFSRVKCKYGGQSGRGVS